MENKSFSKYNHANPVIVKILSEMDIKNPKILDVGCWTGALGKIVKAKVPAEFDGIDNNEDVVKTATAHGYRRIYLFELNTADNIKTIADTYDVVVCGDVLEHVVDPSAVLGRLKEKTKKHGYIIVSLPNIGFILYRLLHLIGRWEYREKGVMDKTHVRFFTLKTMKELFLENDLTIEYTTGLNVVRNRYAFLRLLGTIWPSMFAIQIVFLLKKKAI